jgi:uncharacterized membrane protein YgcG
MAVRLKPVSPPKSVPLAMERKEVVLIETDTTSVAAGPAVMDQTMMAPAAAMTMMTPMKDTSNFMTKNYLWVYLLIVIIVLVIIFWYANSKCHKEEFEKLHLKHVEWLKGSSGRCVLGLFLAIALLFLAWGCASTSGMYRCGGDMNKSNMMMGLFGVLVLLVLIAFILFFRGSFSTAYWLMIFTFIIGLLATIFFAFYRMTTAACCLGLFSAFSLFCLWIFHKVNRQNPCNHGNGHGHSGSSGHGSSGSSGSSGGSGSSGSGGSPSRVSNRSPH